MEKKILIALILLLAVAAGGIAWTVNARAVLYHTAYGGLIAAIGVGTAAGVVKALWGRKRQPVTDAPRHNAGSFLEHWGTGLGIIILIVSAALLSSGRKIGFIVVPEIARSRIMALNLHYLGTLFTLLFGCFFLADLLVSGGYKNLLPNAADIKDGTLKRYFLGKKWVDTGKYQVTQKWAFLAMAILGGIVLVTGIIKSAYFIWPVPINAATALHDYASELFFILLIVHVLFAVAVPGHWRLLLSWFTGRK
jgi:cytochrome b subunit of formate dehydrogenase